MRVIWTPLVLRPPVIQALLKGGQEFTRDRDRPEEFRGHLGELLEQCIDFVNRLHRFQGLIGKAVHKRDDFFFCHSLLLFQRLHTATHAVLPLVFLGVHTVANGDGGLPGQGTPALKIEHPFPGVAVAIADFF